MFWVESFVKTFYYLLDAIDPTYAFAINNGKTSYDYELKQWAFNRSLSTAKPVSMPYYVANEKKTIAYDLKYGLLYFYLVVSEILLIFAEKFIMSDYGADGYNETAQGNAFPHPTGSC